MTIKKFEKLIAPIIKELESEDDHYHIVHFSRKDDKYFGYTNIDLVDAFIINKELTRYIDQYERQTKNPH